ncbi:MAG TPA: Minf_1886 family protein, partial [Pirellulales bacterium]
MSDAATALEKLVKEDKRYKKPAYIFVFDSLTYAHSELGMGGEGSEATEGEESAERHLTGQQLCEGIRQYALDQYGYMAKCVLNSWGVTTTGDFGEIVFNLIR